MPYLLSLLTVLGGSLVCLGIAYPGYARDRGWPVGKAERGHARRAWFLLGGLAYLWGMSVLFGLLGFALALPLGLMSGFVLLWLLGRRTRFVSWAGPVLSATWLLAEAVPSLQS